MPTKRPQKHWRDMTDSERRLAAREATAETVALMERIVPAHLRPRPHDSDSELTPAGRCFKQVRSILRQK